MTRRYGVLGILALLVGMSLLSGCSTQNRAESDVVDIWNLAEAGDGDAQFYLGHIYATGEGVPQDDKQAFEWYLKAAQQGNASAQYNLGFMYATGHGVPKDEKQAAEWHSKAAEQGHAGAQYNLGIMYGKGSGMPQDNVTAYAWLSLAAAQGEKGAIAAKDIVSQGFTPEQHNKAQALAAELQVKIDKKKK